MEIVGRKRISGSHDFADALEAAEKLQQGALAFDDGYAASRSDELGVTHEVDRIAKSLLGMNEDAPTVERASVPARLGKLALGGWVRLEARFIEGPSALEIAEEEQENGVI